MAPLLGPALGRHWDGRQCRDVIEVPRPSVDRVECASDPPIIAIVAVESVDVKPFDDPREAGALTK